MIVIGSMWCVPAPHRLLRATVAALVASGLGSAAHLATGGSVPIPGALAGLVVLLGPMWLAAGRERSRPTIAALQLGGQQIVHALLAITATTVHPDVLPDDVMLCGHLAAATLAAAWLRRGEQRLWAAARRTAASMAAWWRWVLRITDRGIGTLPVFLVPGPALPRPCPGAVLRHAVVRRGPPLPA